MNIATIDSPIGPLAIGTTDDALVLLEFAEPTRLAHQLERIRQTLGELSPGRSPLIDDTQLQLDDYFAGRRRDFDLPLRLIGTSFQMSVWNALREIPPGETRSYTDVAVAIGRPDAVRAVARANGENRLAIVVPCHRVIGANGQLVGYGGGLWRKERLLALERGTGARLPGFD